MAKEKLIEAEAPEGRRERKRRQTRERIEQAAMALFLERGFDATTIEDITEAADVSKRSFFDYFPSKEDVVAPPVRDKCLWSRGCHPCTAALYAQASQRP
jgi:AcrR family transcriptional regulator